MSVRLRLLGLPEIIYKNEQKALRLSNPSLLLIYLAYKADWVSRSELAFLFRPDEDEATALKHVRLLLHRAKRLTWASTLETDKRRVRFLIPTDVQTFKKALQDKNWQKVSDLYTGDFLGDYSAPTLPSYTAWLELERSDLSSAYEEALRSYAKELDGQGRYKEASKVWQILLKQDALAESTLQAYVRSLSLAGDREKALKVYETFAKALAQEYGAEPLEATQALARAIRANESLAAAPQDPIRISQLPKQTTRFVGRQQDLKLLIGQLRDPACRLLTLIGLGGTGKTRLALELARLEQARFKDGALFIPLAAASSVEQALTAIAQGLKLELAQDPKAQLFHYLQDKELLLVLDNFEHLLEAAPLVGELLVSCHDLQIVVTSRESLNLSSEWLFDVKGLSYPEAKSGDDSLYDANALFIDGMKRVAPQVKPSAEDLIHISEISRRLEGLPLALELASSWARIMPVARIAKELAKGHDLLATELADVPERHRSLQSILEATFSRLAQDDQRTFLRLAVFNGSFSLEAAEGVTGASFRFLLTLSSLSLIKRSRQNRFELHGLIKQFLLTKAQSKLDKANKEHFSFYKELTKDIDAGLVSDDFNSWAQTWFEDYPNILKALEWGLAKLPKEAAELLKDLLPLWQRYNLYLDTEHWLNHALTLDILTVNDRAFVLTRLAAMVRGKGDLQRADTLLKKALELSQDANNTELVVENLSQMGRNSIMLGHYEDAKHLLEEAVTLAKRLDNDGLKVGVFNNLGLLKQNLGDRTASIQFRQQALAAAKRTDNKHLIARQLNNLGCELFLLERYDEAGQVWHESLGICRLLSHRALEGSLSINLGNLAEVKEDYAEALKLIKYGLNISFSSGFRNDFFLSATDLARVLATLGETQRAAYLLGYAKQLQDQHDYAYSRSQNPDALKQNLKASLGEAHFSEHFTKGKLATEKEIGEFLSP